jgi:hypothetical protein
MSEDQPMSEDYALPDSHLTILDPRTGEKVTISVPRRQPEPDPDWKAWDAWVAEVTTAARQHHETEDDGA